MTSIVFKMTRWILACFLGWLLGVVLIILLSSVLDAMGIEHMQFYLGVGMGAGVGFMQWRQLKKYLNISLSWIWASAVGMGLPFIIVDLLFRDRLAHPIAVSIVCGSLLTGILQYLLLKPFSSRALLWLPACCVAWILAVAATFSMDYTMQWKDQIGPLALALINFTLILSGGPLLGWITGTVLKRILSHQ